MHQSIDGTLVDKINVVYECIFADYQERLTQNFIG